jgi:hypothetical protein
LHRKYIGSKKRIGLLVDALLRSDVREETIVKALDSIHHITPDENICSVPQARDEPPEPSGEIDFDYSDWLTSQSDQITFIDDV